MFEYKVRCRHKLGWKEFKLYADTDIEEFFNRNSIDYVRNITDIVENRQLQEIDRLNNIINGIEAYCNMAITMNFNMNNSKLQEQIVEDYTNVLDKLKELKENK